MTEEDIIRSIERIVQDEPSAADAVLKLKSSQRVDMDQPGRGGGRIALFVAAAGLAAAAFIMPLTYHRATSPVAAPAVQPVPAFKRPPRGMPGERPSPKAYAAVLPTKPARLTAHKPEAVAPLDDRPRAPTPDPAIAEPLTGEALQAALIEDTRRTREVNQKELTTLRETAPH